MGASPGVEGLGLEIRLGDSQLPGQGRPAPARGITATWESRLAGPNELWGAGGSPLGRRRVAGPKALRAGTPWERSGPSERGRNRTFNLWIKSPLLCQLSYTPSAKAARFVTDPAVLVNNRVGEGTLRSRVRVRRYRREQKPCAAVRPERRASDASPESKGPVPGSRPERKRVSRKKKPCWPPGRMSGHDASAASAVASTVWSTSRTARTRSSSPSGSGRSEPACSRTRPPSRSTSSRTCSPPSFI